MVQVFIAKPDIVAVKGEWVTLPQKREELFKILSKYPNGYIVTDYAEDAIYFKDFIQEIMNLATFNEELCILEENGLALCDGIFAAAAAFDGTDFSDFVFKIVEDRIKVLDMNDTKGWQMGKEEAAGRLLWQEGLLATVDLTGVNDNIAQWIDWEDVFENELDWSMVSINQTPYLVNTNF